SANMFNKSADWLIDDIIKDPENYLQSKNENIRKNGDKVWVRWANRPIRDHRGQITEILSIGIDVTETIRFEESLKTEHDILDSVVNNVDIGFFVMQPDGNVILHNDSALNIHDLTLDGGEMMNLNDYTGHYILESPDGRRLDLSEWPITLALQNRFVKNFEARLVRLRSRTSRMISLNSIPVYDASGKVKLIVFTITDFTEIYERTKALEESRQRYESLFNNATMAIQHCRIVTDENGNPVDYEMFNINNTGTKIIGITKEQVYGKRATEIFPDLDKGPFNFIEQFGKVALEGGELNAEVFFESLGKWLSIYAYCPKKGEFTAFFSDITPRKLAEIEIQKAKEKAEESDRLKSAFLANMSHEIRTPMNGILGFADLLKNPNLSGEKQQMYVEAINMSGRRMLSIINDLIDISKIEAGQIEVKKTNTDIPKLLKEVVTFFRPEADKNKIILSLNLGNMPSSEFFIETDKTKLFQITANLVKNALKFTRPNGVIELGCRINDHDNIFFYVKDNGIGIREELREKIFERFRQGDTAEEHEGVGLGLAISKAYVELLGGKIGVESEEGKGSVFYFTLPYGRNILPFKNGHLDEKKSENSLSSKKILIVEDDEMSFILLKEILGGRNLEIIRALNGLEAVEIIRKNDDIDLILMDVKLPVMDGIEATTEIKKINPCIPVIMQSAYAGQEEIERAFSAGSDDYMTKPINAEKFLDRISELVS
ncbi:MAG TPA: ATP-binding protein, partial [Bacteroidales bacterium]|nr:ATP-binding protein [Bacteroidales bacterium]